MLYVTGDLRGNGDELIHRIMQHPLEDGDTIILDGDVGLHNGINLNNEFAYLLSNLPYQFIVIRGNDDVRYCEYIKNHNITYEEDTFCTMKVLVVQNLENVLFAPDDFGIIKHSKYGNILLIAGGGEVNGMYRNSHGFVDTGYNDLLSDAELKNLQNGVSEFINNGNNIDYVISHIAPLSLAKKGASMVHLDSLAHACKSEKTLDELYKVLKPTLKTWYFSHFLKDGFVDGIGCMVYKDILKIS